MQKYVIKNFPVILFHKEGEFTANFGVPREGKTVLAGSIAFEPNDDGVHPIDNIPMDIAEQLCLNGFHIQVHKEVFQADYVEEFAIKMVRGQHGESLCFTTEGYTTDCFKRAVGRSSSGMTTTRLYIKDEDAL